MSTPPPLPINYQDDPTGAIAQGPAYAGDVAAIVLDIRARIASAQSDIAAIIAAGTGGVDLTAILGDATPPPPGTASAGTSPLARREDAVDQAMPGGVHFSFVGDGTAIALPAIRVRRNCIVTELSIEFDVNVTGVNAVFQLQKWSGSAWVNCYTTTTPPTVAVGSTSYPAVVTSDGAAPDTFAFLKGDKIRIKATSNITSGATGTGQLSFTPGTEDS